MAIPIVTSHGYDQLLAVPSNPNLPQKSSIFHLSNCSKEYSPTVKVSNVHPVTFPWTAAFQKSHCAFKIKYYEGDHNELDIFFLESVELLYHHNTSIGIDAQSHLQ